VPTSSVSVRPTAGRPPSTTHSELERVAFDLFQRNGFDQTSVEDIARAAGIGRRTFFRYYATKADVVWGDFDSGLSRMRQRLDASDAGVPMVPALRDAVIDFNTFPTAEEGWHRRRMGLILGEPVLYANSTLRFTAWRAEIARFAARRLRVKPSDLAPVVVGYSALGASLAAYEQWLARPGTNLTRLLETAWDAVGSGFGARPSTRGASSGRRG
jgi:mycofactocin system transcriptional regulator